MGDPKRLFIGGVQSLYRVQAYTGTWEGDKKQGIGESTALPCGHYLAIWIIF